MSWLRCSARAGRQAVPTSGGRRTAADRLGSPSGISITPFRQCTTLTAVQPRVDGWVHVLCRPSAQALDPSPQNGMLFVKRHLSCSSIRCNNPQGSSTASRAGTVDYLLADVGEGITECEIVKWFVEPGAHVEEFDVLVEVQSDKASVEITSRYTGRLVEHCYQVGQVARVGSPLCRIELEGRGSDGTEVGTEEQTETQKREPGTDVEEQGRTSGHSEAQFASEQRQDDEAVNDDGQTLDRTRAEKRERHRTLATPAVRRLTRENGLQIGQVLGTGRDGRVTKEDVQNHLSGAARSGGTPVLQDRSSLEEERQKHQGMATTRVAPLSGVRKAMFKAMSATWTAPHFGYSEEVNVTKLDLIRKQLAQRRTLPLRDEDGVDGENVKLTLLPFLLKALSLALQNHPLFRSTLDVQGMNLIQSDQHRLSLAFASSKGLVTPALRGDVRQLSIIDIARQIANLQKLGAVRGLSQEELGSGATVTLSNIGSIGGTHTFPLIPPTGQLVIGAVGRTRVLPRFDEAGNVVKASILPVSFSADHRVVEGVELARFVDDWKRLLEEPTAWLLHMH